jgi:hypothetical protein
MYWCFEFLGLLVTQLSRYSETQEEIDWTANMTNDLSNPATRNSQKSWTSSVQSILSQSWYRCHRLLYRCPPDLEQVLHSVTSRYHHVTQPSVRCLALLSAQAYNACLTSTSCIRRNSRYHNLSSDFKLNCDFSTFQRHWSPLNSCSYSVPNVMNASTFLESIFQELRAKS